LHEASQDQGRNTAHEHISTCAEPYHDSACATGGARPFTKLASWATSPTSACWPCRCVLRWVHRAWTPPATIPAADGGRTPNTSSDWTKNQRARARSCRPGLPTSQIEEFAALPTQVLTAEGAKHTARFYCIFMLCLCVNFTAALRILYPYVDRVFILGLSSQLQAHVLFHRDIVTLRKSKNRSKSVRIGHTYKKHLSCATVNNAHKSTFILISSRHGVLTLIWLHSLQYTCVIISNSHLLLLYINPSMWVISLLRFIWSVLQ